MRGIALRATLALIGIAILPGCGKRETFEKAGRKADEAVQKASDSAKEAADRLKATAAAAGAQAADTAGRVGGDVKEGAAKVGVVVKETAGNVQRDVQGGHRLPTPAPTNPPTSKKPMKY